MNSVIPCPVTQKVRINGDIRMKRDFMDILDLQYISDEKFHHM